MIAQLLPKIDKCKKKSNLFQLRPKVLFSAESVRTPSFQTTNKIGN
jgi:hypothetical protein